MSIKHSFSMERVRKYGTSHLIEADFADIAIILHFQSHFISAAFVASMDTRHLIWILILKAISTITASLFYFLNHLSRRESLLNQPFIVLKKGFSLQLFGFWLVFRIRSLCNTCCYFSKRIIVSDLFFFKVIEDFL